MTSWNIYNVGIVHLDVSPESDRAAWIEGQLSLHGLTTSQYPYAPSESLAGHPLSMIQAECNFIVFLFSQHTPELTSLAATTVMQLSDEWVMFVRCDDSARHVMLADRDHFDIFGDEAEAQLAAMVQRVQSLLAGVRDHP